MYNYALSMYTFRKDVICMAKKRNKELAVKQTFYGVMVFVTKDGKFVYYDSKKKKFVSVPCVFRYTLGNDKVKAFNYAFIPGDDPITRSDGMPYTNLKGTCGGCCDGCVNDCYAVRAFMVHNNATVVPWAMNTWLFINKPHEFFKQRREAIAKENVTVVRPQEGGEYPSKRLMEMDFIDMSTYKNVDFYLYTKRFAWYFDIKANVFGGKLPKNVHVNLSEWHNNIEVTKEDAFFRYDDGSMPELDHKYHCKAVNIKGGMSDTWHCNAPCKRCVLAKPGTETCVYAHGKEKWHRTEAIVIEYLAKHPTETILDIDGKTWVSLDDIRGRVS